MKEIHLEGNHALTMGKGGPRRCRDWPQALQKVSCTLQNQRTSQTPNLCLSCKFLANIWESHFKVQTGLITKNAALPAQHEEV